mgnify:CR=1 FL=1
MIPANEPMAIAIPPTMAILDALFRILIWDILALITPRINKAIIDRAIELFKATLTGKNT